MTLQPLISAAVIGRGEFEAVLEERGEQKKCLNLLGDSCVLNNCVGGLRVLCVFSNSVLLGELEPSCL